jgi:hypothetical protein
MPSKNPDSLNKIDKFGRFIYSKKSKSGSWKIFGPPIKIGDRLKLAQGKVVRPAVTHKFNKMEDILDDDGKKTGEQELVFQRSFHPAIMSPTGMTEHEDGVFLFLPRSDHPYYEGKEEEKELCVAIEKLLEKHNG